MEVKYIEKFDIILIIQANIEAQNTILVILELMYPKKKFLQLFIMALTMITIFLLKN